MMFEKENIWILINKTMNNKIVEQQKAICKKFNVEWFESLPTLKVGISKNVREGVEPINGLRHSPEGDTTGWYIWAGQEMLDDPGFFVPVHVEHLGDWCPQALAYLGLPPGTRFLIAKTQEDVWEDKSLLDI